MSAIEKFLSYAKDVILVTERLDALTKAVGNLANQVEDQERRLIRIETIIELSMKVRLPPVVGDPALEGVRTSASPHNAPRISDSAPQE